MITWVGKGKVENVNELVEVWEASVRATHDFLNQEDIEFYKCIVREALMKVTLLVSRADNGAIKGFIGFNPGCIEMLFVHPDWIRKGVGRSLALHAIKMHCRKVDVNEQNLAARRFYEAMTFKEVGRDAVDSYGKPYPILHMESLLSAKS